MCGFVGFTNHINDASIVVEKMMDRIAHRGPDQAGKYVDEKVAMGFRRLSIIDLSELGSQPIFNEDGSVKSNEVWAQDPEELESTDGMIMDEDGNLYIADFCANAIVKVSPDGKTVRRLAQSPECTALEGGLDQPGEPIIWNNRIIAACFDTVVNDIVRNTAHELPATLAEIELD